MAKYCISTFIYVFTYFVSICCSNNSSAGPNCFCRLVMVHSILADYENHSMSLTSLRSCKWFESNSQRLCRRMTIPCPSNLLQDCYKLCYSHSAPSNQALVTFESYSSTCRPVSVSNATPANPLMAVPNALLCHTVIS